MGRAASQEPVNSSNFPFTVTVEALLKKTTVFNMLQPVSNNAAEQV